MSLKVVDPDVTSGTLSMVVPDPQVTEDWMDVTESWTSCGRASLPTTKQAFWRDSRGATERVCQYILIWSRYDASIEQKQVTNLRR